jgi:ribosomal protein S18 acetylase RimI-like enzyme
MLLTDQSQDATFSIQPASWHDLNDLRHLEKICFPKDSWPLIDLISVLTFPNILRFKAVIGANMVGFLAADKRKAESMGWIATIGVIPEHRGKGIATALLQTAENTLNMPRIRLNVRASNRDAIRLYRELGYEEVSIWPAYYQDKEDALILEKQIQA